MKVATTANERADAARAAPDLSCRWRLLWRRARRRQARADAPASAEWRVPRRHYRHGVAGCAVTLALTLALAAAGCAAPAARDEASRPEGATHRIHVVLHGWHTGIVLRAGDIPPEAWPARREFPQAEFLEVGWGDRAYYQAADAGLWLGLRALLWPTPGVLHFAALDEAPERYFAAAGIVEVNVTGPGLAALVAAVRGSHEFDAAGDPLPLGPGLYGASRFYASRERFHLLKTCNVWTASVLRAAGLPLEPSGAITADALFAQLRALGRVLREPR